MKNVIEIANLTKKYDTFTLGPIDLSIPSGQIIGLIGENGAGKTTLLKSLLGIIQSTTGEITVLDKPATENANSSIGVVLDNMFFPEILTPKDIDTIMSDIYDNWDKKLFDEYMQKFSLPTNKPLKTLSKGMRKKVEIATALAHHPKLLILDEPTTGLDPVVRSEVLDIFLDFIQDETHTILMSTHITSDLEHIADRIIFIDAGKILIDETKDDLVDEYGILKCDLDCLDKFDENEIVAYRKNRYSCDILVKNKTAIAKKYKDYTIDKITLEDLMLLMIKGERK